MVQQEKEGLNLAHSVVVCYVIDIKGTVTLLTSVRLRRRLRFTVTPTQVSTFGLYPSLSVQKRIILGRLGGADRRGSTASLHPLCCLTRFSRAVPIRRHAHKSREQGQHRVVIWELCVTNALHRLHMSKAGRFATIDQGTAPIVLSECSR